METDRELKALLIREFTIEIRGNTFDAIKTALIEKINDLILTDFQKLVNLLYRIDVSEVRLKQLLQENNDQDAARIIAELIIERQLQKIKIKRKFKSDGDIPDSERW